MKRLFVLASALFALSFASEAFALPTIDHPVTDPSGLIPYDARERVSRMLVAERERPAHNQIAVLVVPDTEGMPIEDFANEVFRIARLGEANRDNGVLIVLAVNTHRDRIEVGRGLEDRLTAPEAAAILEGARNALRAGRLGDAIYEMSEGVVRELGGSPAARPAPREEDNTGTILVLILLGLALGALIVWWRMRSDRRSSGYGRYRGGYSGGDNFFFFNSGGSSSSSRSSDWSSSSSDYSSSDWGGGGGSSDGGGASGDW